MAACLHCSSWSKHREWGDDTETFYVSHSQLWGCSHQYYCRRRFLILYSPQQYQLQSFTWPLVGAQTTDINTALSCGMVTGHYHGPWWQHTPCTSTWALDAAHTMDIHMEQHGPQISTWPQLSARLQAFRSQVAVHTSDTNMASSSITDHKH